MSIVAKSVGVVGTAIPLPRTQVFVFLFVPLADVALDPSPSKRVKEYNEPVPPSLLNVINPPLPPPVSPALITIRKSV